MAKKEKGTKLKPPLPPKLPPFSKEYYIDRLESLRRKIQFLERLKEIIHEELNSTKIYSLLLYESGLTKIEAEDIFQECIQKFVPIPDNFYFLTNQVF